MFQGPRALAAADAPLAIASPSVEVLSRLALAAELAGVLEAAGGLAGLATASLEAWGERGHHRGTDTLLTLFTTLMARKSTSAPISSLSTSNSLLTRAICLATASPSCCRPRLVTAA